MAQESALTLSQLQVKLLTGIHKLRASSSELGSAGPAFYACLDLSDLTVLCLCLEFEPASKREGAFADLFDVAFVNSHHGDDLLFYVPSGGETEGMRPLLSHYNTHHCP
jgi:hypothetical protein